MEIEEQIDGKNLYVKLIGRLDSSNYQTLSDYFEENLDDIEELTIDMAELNYISSAGLRVILSTQKTMSKQGSMKLINVNDILHEIFDATGFSKILTIE